MGGGRFFFIPKVIELNPLKDMFIHVCVCLQLLSPLFCSKHEFEEISVSLKLRGLCVCVCVFAFISDSHTQNI